MRVSHIEYAGIQDVFNMEVEDTHNYVIDGGIVAHNCYDAFKYICMEHPLNPRKTVKRYTEKDPLPQEDPIEIIKEYRNGH